MDQAISHTPLISVILPVFNCEGYVAEAIDSILNQSFSDFELIIINDGSVDKSEQVILSYKDDRIKYIKNDGNIGLIATLNKGIDLARGKYMARMDADDISLPNRFEIQLSYFEKNNDAAIICSPILGITPEGKSCDGWEVDLKHRTWEQIKKALPHENCIAHPTVMAKTDVLRKYKYNTSQKGSEDWDLWMRLVSDGYKIIKTDEFLLKYRLHPLSVTISGNLKTAVERKIINVKKKFLTQQFLKFKLGLFELTVFYSLLRSVARHLKLNVLPVVLRDIKRLFTIDLFKTKTQFVALERFCKNNLSVEISFFFPYCHIGGAEKVHANIVEVFADRKAVVFITGISKRDDFLYMFNSFAPTLNVGFCLNHPFYRRRSEKLIKSLIELQPNPLIFGCNNIFFYDLILSVSKKVRVFDLIHDFVFENNKVNASRLAAQYARCEKRIFISNKAIEETKKMYAYKFMDDVEYSKIVLIPNYTEIPTKLTKKAIDGKLNVLYVGRGTSEKRAHLVGEIAITCNKITDSIKFTAIGALENTITPSYKKYVDYTGAINDFNELKKYYERNHIILITSEREGFPLTIMEGMAHGLIPISTPVGDVPVYVNDKVGFVTSTIDEKITVNEMTTVIVRFSENRIALAEMSEQAFLFAQQHFSKKQFFDSYKNTVKMDL